MSRPDPTPTVLEALFAHPPVSHAELERRLAPADAARARQLLVARLRGGLVSEQDRAVFIAVFGALGAGEVRSALRTLVLDAALPAATRGHALTILADEPAQLEALLRELPPEEIAPLAEHWLADLLGAIQADPRQGEGLAGALEASPPELRGVLLEQIEAQRARVGTSAAAAYGRALLRDALAALRPRLLELLVLEASPEGIALLEQLRRQAPVGLGRELQRAALLARTRRLDPREQASSGRALVGSCDGQGAFIVVGCFENLDGTLTLADLCVRAAGDIRDGFVLPRRGPQELSELLAEITDGTGLAFAAAPLPQVAALIAGAAARTHAAGCTLPPEARPAVTLFERWAPPEPEPAPEAGLVRELAPAERPSLESVRELLRRPEYDRSWFFDRGDLDGVELPLPAHAAALPAWVRAAAQRLERPPLRSRLVAMAGHMARWHAWRGEAAEASLCAALARVTEQAFGASPLVTAMLERSIVPAGEEPLADASVDRAMLRQHLKGLFFQHVCSPKGRDLARLDFTEAALTFLDEALLGLPGERRPREADRTTAAYAIGRVFADFLIAGARWPIERVIEEMTRALTDFCHLDADESQRVVATVLPALGGYIDQHCAGCPIACLDRPSEDVADAFFSPHHPDAG